MKKSTLLLIFALVLTRYGFSQAPQGFPYQAVARDNGGNLIANHNISLRFSILDGSNVGTTVYQETQTATTNSLGLFNLNIGQGTVVSGTFNAINWASGAKFIKVELDTSGGNTFTLMGITQLMSVPYALYANQTFGSPSTNAWGLIGNDSTNSATNFIGTTDTASLIIKTNNQLSGLLSSYNSNTSYGYQTLQSNTNYNNTAIGYNTLKLNTNGG